MTQRFHDAMKTFGTRTLLVIIALVAIVCGLIIPAIQAARATAREMACSNNLKQIGLALLNYESAYRRLPLAIEIKSDGQLWRSWRSHVYPNFMDSRPHLYDDTTAWDSNVNLRLIHGTPIATPWCFTCPECKDCKGVNYVVVTGDGTAFPRSAQVKLSDITDGLENTILVVESVNCTPDWTEPRDLDIETMDFRINSRDNPSISSRHRGGALVCFADMEIYKITPKVTESELRALLTIAGGEDVKREDLIARGVLLKGWKQH